MEFIKNTDLIDIREQLQFKNNLIQAKGFSLLADRILKSNLSGKSHEEHRKLLLDCLYEYGDTPHELLLELLPILLQKEIIKKQDLLEEFIIRLPKISRIERTFPVIIKLCEPSIVQFLGLCSKMKAETLTKICISKEMEQNNHRFIKVLLFSELLSNEQKRIVGNRSVNQKMFLRFYPDLHIIGDYHENDQFNFLRECSNEELLAHSLSEIDIFRRLELMQERSEIIRNPNLKSHVLYLPYMFLLNQSRQLIFKLLEDPKTSQQSLELRAKVAECQVKTIEAPPNFSEEKWSLELVLRDVIANESIESFVRFVEHYKGSLSMFRKSHVLPFLTVLLSHCMDSTTHERICALIISFVNDSPEQADTFVLYFVGLYVKPFFPICKKLILDTLVNLAVNRFALVPISTLLCMLVQKSDERCEALACLPRIVKQFPSTIQSVSKCFNLHQADDPKDIFLAKLQLTKECCLATDDNDEFISSISKLLKESGFRLTNAIDVILDLVKHDVLELRPVRKQLLKKVTLPGNVEALSAYCRLLSIGSVPNPEDSEEQNHDLKIDCIKELYSYTKNDSNDVAAEAWRALGHYELTDIEEALNLSPSTLGTEFQNLPKQQQDGFVNFLSEIIRKEAETYQRPLYNVGARTAEVPPLLAKVDTYKDQLALKNKEETWFWRATLPLSASILELSAPSNKALTGLRILKACLQNVPSATSQEEMLRLMASWRICVRATLNALSESKSNDIIWARDQICQEGRLSLTQKSESVDNIMMMLTVLADCLEENLRTNDDEKYVDEITKSQKPWIISVFEFVATRLPKDVKQKREPKENPIYQVLTSSNKSSLFTAMFCIRLLYQNPNIMEFYHDEKEIGLVEDIMFDNLLKNSSTELTRENVPTQQMLWVTAEAYGADEMTVRTFASTYRKIINEKSMIPLELSLESCEDLDKFFNALVMAPKDSLIDVQQKNRKNLEKMWNNGTDETRRTIYTGLSELALISGNSHKKKMISIDRLPESSILKGVLHIFDEKNKVDSATLLKLVESFVNHKRSDGRYLPPLDWLKLLERADWKEANDDSRLAVITLACEQSIPEVLFHFSENLSVKELLKISEHLRTVSKLLARNQFLTILKQIVDQSRKESDFETTKILASSIGANQKNPVIRMFLANELPDLSNTIAVTDSILKELTDPTDFGGLVSSCFDVWLEARNGEKMNMKRICDAVNAEENIRNRNAMFSLISSEARQLSMKKRVDKILDVITASRIARSQSSDMSNFFPVMLSLIVTSSDKLETPVCWFGNEERVLEIMTAAAIPYFKNVLEYSEVKKDAKHIGSFLRPYVEGDETNVYEEWQKSLATELLLMLIASFSSDALPTLLDESDSFWLNALRNY